MNIDKALSILKSELINDGEDGYYFKTHYRRYVYMCKKFYSFVPEGSLVLDIGSHNLHQSILLSLLGYKITALDMKEFTEKEFVINRAQKYNIELVTVDNLQNGFENNLSSYHYDLVLFTEIMEHITFNPGILWKDINQVLKTNGLIYISTPNSMRLLNIIHHIKNIILLRSIGLDHVSILNQVTYGHHWKEYSSWEIKKYFNELFDNYKIIISYYYYRELSDNNGIKKFLRKIIIKTGRLFKIVSDELDIVLKKLF